MNETRKERPIIFSGPMIRAILDGRKLQARRAIADKHFGRLGLERDGLFVYTTEGQQWTGEFEGGSAPWSPYGQRGDRLWVRETWAPICTFDPSPETGAVYKADNHPSQSVIPCKWKPSIHMPRWASRITLEIIGVRVERLQNINKADAIAEGSQCAGVPASLSDVGAFAKLWESIHGQKSWTANPWVWVIQFQKVDQTPCQ